MPLNARLPNKAAPSPLTAKIWFPVAAPDVTTWEDLIFAGSPLNKFIAVGLGGASRVMRSSNGKSWAVIAVPADCVLEWRTVAYGNGRLIALSGNSAGADRRVMQSLDGGATWSLQAQAVESTRYRHLMWLPQWAMFFGVGDGGAGRKLIRSPTGVDGTWITQLFSAALGQISSVAFSPTLGATPGRLLVVPQGSFGAMAGTSIAFSDANPPVDASWTIEAGRLTDRTGGGTVVYERVLWIPDFGGRFIAVGNQDNICTHPTGIGSAWTLRAGSGYAVDAGRVWLDIKYIAPLKRLVAIYNGVAGLPHVGISDNGGDTWTLQDAAEATNWAAVDFGANLAVAVASAGVNRIMTSPR